MRFKCVLVFALLYEYRLQKQATILYGCSVKWLKCCCTNFNDDAEKSDRVKSVVFSH